MMKLWVYHGLASSSEKAMAPHSSTLAWKIPWMEELGRLQSMGSLRVGLDWATSLSLFTFMHWRRKWQPTPVFLPGESQGQRSLMGCRLWGRTESDTTEATKHSTPLFAHFHCTMIIPIWPHGDKKTPLPDVEEELMLETWCLLKNEEEGGCLSLPTFPLTIKL